MQHEPVPIAYSYIRFSSPEQSKGDSRRRQRVASAEWCNRNKAQLDTSLKVDGVASLHSGETRRKQAFGAVCRP